MTDSASDCIRFEDGIQPAKSREKQFPFTESSSASDNATADADDLQKKFADQDLNHKKKQVSKLPFNFFSGPPPIAFHCSDLVRRGDEDAYMATMTD